MEFRHGSRSSVKRLVSPAGAVCGWLAARHDFGTKTVCDNLSAHIIAEVLAQIVLNGQIFVPERHRPRPHRDKPHKLHADKPLYEKGLN